MLLTRNCKGWDRSVPAFSMMETVVSMTILLTILTISFVALDRINNSMNPGAQYKAHLVTNQVVGRDDLLLGEVDEYEVEGFVVKKKIIPQLNGMYLVELTVQNGFGNTIYVRKILKSNGIKL